MQGLLHIIPVIILLLFTFLSSPSEPVGALHHLLCVHSADVPSRGKQGLLCSSCSWLFLANPFLQDRLLSFGMRLAGVTPCTLGQNQLLWGQVDISCGRRVGWVNTFGGRGGGISCWEGGGDGGRG